MTDKLNIIVVHGALGSAQQMEPAARALESLGTVTNVELPGHGRSDADASEFSMHAFAQHLHQVVSEMRHSDAVAPIIFGYSMGGYAALTLETQHPGSFAGIVTLGTKFAWTPELAARECSRLNTKTIAEKIPKFAKTLEERHAGAGGWELVLDRTAGVLIELGNHPILTHESLAKIQCKVSIAVGEKDDTVSADETFQYASYIPHATSEVLPDTPHPIERVPVESIVTLVRKHCLPA